MQRIRIEEIRENPENPRKITEGSFAKLVASMKEDPQMIEAKPLVVFKNSGFYVVLGGNMRLRALHAIGAKEVPVFDATQWTEEERRRFVVKDNVSSGEWDYELLSAQYDAEELESWGMNAAKELGGYGMQSSEADDFSEEFEISVVCHSRSERKRVHDELSGMGYELRPISD